MIAQRARTDARTTPRTIHRSTTTMNSTTKNALAITRLLGNRGCTVSSVTVHTPDGREWAIDIDSPMGYRLYEIDPNDRESAEEHHAIDDDTWTASDLINYLKAVGEPRPGNATTDRPTPRNT